MHPCTSNLRYIICCAAYSEGKSLHDLFLSEAFGRTFRDGVVSDTLKPGRFVGSCLKDQVGSLKRRPPPDDSELRAIGAAVDEDLL
jgi:hypothetical protein